MPDGKGRPERYLTTVLMTDIVGSTQHAAEMGDSDWRELIAQHHKIARAALKGHGGREIDTAGDGFFAIFDAPAAAVTCALEIERDVQALGIEIRAGVHTGEVEQAGPKVTGIAVPIASRIMAAADASEVLVSATVRDLASGAGLEFEDRGTRELKGVPGEWHIYAAASPAVGSSAAPDEDAASLRAAAVHRRRSRPIWQRQPRTVGAVAVLLVVVLVAGLVLVWQPWLPPALAEIGSDSVGVIDGGRSVIVASIKVDARPAGVAVEGDTVWVANNGSDTVSQIDAHSHSQTRVIDVGNGPVGIAAADGSVWVANNGSRTVSRINESTGRVVGTITVGNGPLSVAAADGTIWVANATDSTMSRIDAASGATLPAVPVAAGPVAVAADSTGVWVASADAAAITHLDAATGVTLATPITLSSRPTSIASGSGSIWVASADGTLTRIDPVANRVTSTVDVGTSLAAVAANGNAVWVADRDGYVLRLDATNPASPPVRIATTNSPAALAVDGVDVWVGAGSTASSHHGGVLKVVDTQLPALDLAYFSSVVQFEGDGLVGYRRVGGTAGASLVADLAAALAKPTDGGLKYTYQLRGGLRYSTGETVVASDFRRGLERSFTIIDPLLGNAMGGGFSMLAGANGCISPDPGQVVETCDLSAGVITDDQQGLVTFVLEQPDPEFPYLLTNTAAFPIPPSVPASGPIDGPFPGTGPYTVSSHSSTQVTLTRNPNFTEWDPDARPDGLPNEIDWLVQPDPEAATAMVERGDADYMRLSLDNRPSPATLEQIRDQLTGQVHFASNSVTSVTMNTARPPFDSLEVRKAVNMAIDRSHVVDLRGGPSVAAITCQYLAPRWPAYQPNCPYTTNPDPSGRWQAPNLDAAKELVAQSGTQHAKIVVGPALSIFSDVRDYLAAVLGDLGYDDVSVDTNTDQDHVFLFDPSRVQTSVWEWFPGKPTPADSLLPFRCDQGTTYTNYCDPQFDSLVADALNLQTTDIAAANEKWAQADHMLVDAAPWAPLFNEGSDFVSERVGNYQYHLFYGALLDQMCPVMAHNDRRYLEDFGVGQRFEPPAEYVMQLDEMKRYAREFDPQVIHTNESGARDELYGHVIASGWMTLGVTTRLMVLARIVGSTPLVGVSINNLRFLEPVNAGDVLSVEAEVLEVRPSQSKPERGYMVMRVVTRRRNDGKPVLTQDWTLLMPRCAD